MTSTSLMNNSGVRNLERIFEDAQLKGELKLNSRKLKEFPKIINKYDLSDVFRIDVSKNRLGEVPEEVCRGCPLVEDLQCYNNVIRSVPESIINLQTLTFLDLSRNQLTVIPVCMCRLPLQVLNLRNNRLVSIPEELSLMKRLQDLDVSCNEIAILPPQLGLINSLQRLNLKRNLLLEIPLELCQLRLTSLDLSANRISAVPTQLRYMTSLQDLYLDYNPITFPPAVLCKRGKVHVFKFLEIQAIKEDKRGIVLETEFQKFRSPSILSDSRYHNGFVSAGCCRKSYTFDSGYSTSDGDNRSQESQEFIGVLKKYSAESPRWETVANHNTRNQNSNAFMGSGGETPEGFDGSIQTFREYKEALKKKRDAEAIAVYKRPSSDDGSAEMSPKLSMSKTISTVASKQLLRKCDSPLEESSKLSWQSESPKHSEASSESIAKMNNNNDIGSPLKCNSIGRKISALEDRIASLSAADSPPNNFARPKNIHPPPKSFKSNFTMKREFDKAREEKELISQLREILESRLKVRLPDELESALGDGVFLCHLANHVRANSVTCIHVPSPAVPKLTIAKCRRNADNFLDACRRIGVPNAELISWAESFIEVREASQTRDFSYLRQHPNVLAALLLSLLIGTSLFLYCFPDND